MKDGYNTVQPLTAEGAKMVVDVNNQMASTTTFNMETAFETMQLGQLEGLLGHLEDKDRKERLNHQAKLQQVVEYLPEHQAIVAM